MILRAPIAFALLAACGPAAVEVPVPLLAGVEPDVVRAVEQARSLVLDDPASGEAWGALADRYAAHHFYPEAILCYERARELDPDTPSWAYRLGWLRFASGNGDPVEPLESALESLGDWYGPAHEALGQVLLRERRLDEAAERFQRATELDPENSHAEAGLGVIALMRGDLDAACAHFEEAIERNPDHGEAHIALARVYETLGREEEARRHAEISRGLPQITEREDYVARPRLPPAGSVARSDYALQLQREGKLREAANQYRLAVESNPHNAVARQRLATLLVKEGRRDEAIELLEEAERTATATAQTSAYLVRIRKHHRGSEERQSP